MNVNYQTDTTHAYQTITINIQAPQAHIFKLLATTDGIQQWFPQLSFEEEKAGSRLLFDLGNDQYEYFNITDYEPKHHIAYTWDNGHVDFTLEETNENVQLTFKEALPYTFKTIGNDFTGWYFQIQSVKKLAETGQPLSQSDFDFASKTKEIEDILNI
ncbi:SRPBCC domain-containing protein [Mammaliicoccus sp. Dog046]|uniref:SRPBCC domain-containing protein n=1 Tax=Mammaliicoccus sp. Dog046 TaxID=3034233 RepID=UPI002B25DFD9|nr:SRPBCC domain-containing protein [Mammaliicoccus sp. Dog046]WQK85385.1 SRPBCC domain-containing protein [Mammaliicoccus sp. Dog046]